MTTTVHETHCPYCGRRNELHTGAYNASATPKDNDVMFCVGCGWFGVWDSGLIRKPNRVEAMEISASVECEQVFVAWRRAHAPC